MDATFARRTSVCLLVTLCAGCQSGGWKWPLARNKEPQYSSWSSTPPEVQKDPVLPSQQATAGSLAKSKDTATYPETPASYVGPATGSGGSALTSSTVRPAGGATIYPSRSASTDTDYALSPSSRTSTGQASTVTPQSGPYAVSGASAGSSTSGALTSGPSYRNGYRNNDGVPTSPFAGRGPNRSSYDEPEERYPTSRYPRTNEAELPDIRTADARSARPEQPADRYALPDRATERRGYETGSPYDPGAPSLSDREVQANPASYEARTLDDAPTSAPDSYRAGTTDYSPGDTSFAPSRVKPYRSPSAEFMDAGTSAKPRYRPGNTSDYLSPTR